MDFDVMNKKAERRKSTVMEFRRGSFINNGKGDKSALKGDGAKHPSNNALAALDSNSKGRSLHSLLKSECEGDKTSTFPQNHGNAILGSGEFFCDPSRIATMKLHVYFYLFHGLVPLFSFVVCLFIEFILYFFLTINSLFSPFLSLIHE